jgi:excinuclease ABC subunit A
MLPVPSPFDALYFPAMLRKMAYSCIAVRGARVHNLKGIDVDIPHHALTVITGLSGSGKSSLAFDTLYAEGQRRYVETFSPYTRQFLERVDKPQVESIEGIPPAIAIEQANAVRTSRSTVGTMTEIADYLKLLFPRAARALCPKCGRELRAWTAPETAADLAAAHPSGEVVITFTVPFPKGTLLGAAADFVRAQGYLRVWRQGKAERLDELVAADPQATVAGDLLVVQDRLAPARDTARLSEALEAAFRFGKGQIRAIPLAAPGEERRYSRTLACPYDGGTLPEPTPALFSFNHPSGACPACRGFGRTVEIDYERALPDKSLTIRQGVVKAFQGAAMSESQRDLVRACHRHEVPLDVPFARLGKADQRFVIEGEPAKGRTTEEIAENGGWYGVKGFFRWLESKSYKMHVRVMLSRYRSYQPCPVCAGSRFQPAPLLFYLLGADGRRRTIAEVNALPLARACDFFESFVLSEHDEPARRLRMEILSRLGYLRDVGLGYLTLDRATRTLSGGEIARVNLTSCLGNSLVNTLFVLDEPTIGLHPRDTGQLLDVIGQLRDRGNTVVLVEHDETVMSHADHVVDLGPGRGEQGGELLYAGPYGGLLADKRSLTGGYLSGRMRVPTPAARRPRKKGETLRIEGAQIHNLRGLDVDIPLGLFVAVTGVSGSGKSSLVHEVIYENLQRAARAAKEQGELPGVVESETVARLTGHEQIGEVVRVDQSPLTRTSRSNPILYLGAYGPIRDLFAQTEGAEAQGLNAGSFSFNGGNGRCPRCGGAGIEKIEMQFLADVFLTCPVCEGKRFQPHVLAVRYRGKNIDDILNMTVGEARAFFAEDGKQPNFIRLRQRQIGVALDLLRDVGLDYLRLGQPLNQLSGGEAQRIKLVSHLANRKPPAEAEDAADEEEDLAPGGPARPPGHRLFILDEPTTGLHFEDVRLLVAVFQRMVDHGDSLLVIEHNLDVIQSADWVVELGPEAGLGGGLLVAEGTPEQVAAAGTATGRFLAEKLRPNRVREKAAPRKGALPRVAATNRIAIHNARHHNLKNLTLEIERGQMTVVTGLSGSGKSTLAFDILFGEGQRRYLDSLNAYARQFVDQMEKPEVDAITGIPPAVAIEQRLTRGGGKSTVATVTEIHQFMRLLFAKLGTAHDPDTGEAAVRQTPAELTERLVAHVKKAGELTVLAPLIKARKGLHTEIAKWAAKKGYPALRVDKKWIAPAKFKALDRFTEHTIDVVLGNLSKKQTEAERRKLIEAALLLGRDTLYVLDNKSRETIYSTALSVPGTGRAFDELDPRLFSFNSPHGWCPECQGYGSLRELPESDARTELEREIAAEQAREGDDEGEAAARPCPSCHGARLNPVARAVRLSYGKWDAPGGPTLPDLGRLPIAEAQVWFRALKLKGRAAAIGRDIVPEIAQRLRFLEEVGLGYLTLDRAAATLSGGESQRIRLAAQLGSNLQGVLYVLDEPTIGLHPRDNERLLDSLDALKAKGNTLVVVEHDEETMKRADRILDLGPGAGTQGGQIVADGTWREIAKNSTSATGLLLGAPLAHPLRGRRRPVTSRAADDIEWLTVAGARANNLKDIDVALPLGRLIVLCGLSGAGKSTFLHEVLKPAVTGAIAARDKRKRGAKAKPSGPWASVHGAEGLSAVTEVDPSPIGKTSRSTPATYLGLMDPLRALFAQMPLARQRGYTASRFSFNSGDGRCESCQGQGRLKIEMQFLPTVLLPCEACGGKRYKPDTLEVLFNGRNIAEVLGMSIDDGVAFFAGVPRLQRPLQLLQKTGLGYLTLGQPSPTLSGGEAQRLKLVTQLFHSLEGALQTRLRGRALAAPAQLFLLEEPTIGLHLADVRRLLEVLHELVDAGHTVVVIEHHLDVIAEADHVIELGPGAGDAGGRIVAAGTPEAVAKAKKSATAPFLKKTLEAAGTAPAGISLAPAARDSK